MEHFLKQYIKKNGFITLDKFMEQILSNNKESYYKENNNILGSTGDFITAPEISQIFGEMLGLWCIEQYYSLINNYGLINIVELGPGKGYLMRDILRVIKLIPQFYNNIIINMIEINKSLIKEQKANLSIFNKDITWNSEIKFLVKKLSNAPTIFIANEFFDALSIKQFIKIEENWKERVIKLKDDKFYFSQIDLSKRKNLILKEKYLNAFEGDVVEESSKSKKIINLISSYIQNFTGAALIIDYGYKIKPEERRSNTFISTLQTVKNHNYHPLFSNLGRADLTAHIDFYEFCEEVKKHRKIKLEELLTQRDFLLKYDIIKRKNLLKQQASNEEKNILDRQVERLIGKKHMGNLFKVLAFHNY